MYSRRDTMRLTNPSFTSSPVLQHIPLETVVCKVWELLCAGFRHSACLPARVILDGATCQPRELRDVRDVPSVLAVWLDR